MEEEVKYIDTTGQSSNVIDDDLSKYVDTSLKTKTQTITGKDFEEKVVYLGDINVPGSGLIKKSI
jgi:hypothetical protein